MPRRLGWLYTERTIISGILILGTMIQLPLTGTPSRHAARGYFLGIEDRPHERDAQYYQAADRR